MELVPASATDVQQLINLCLDCHATCEATVSHCLGKGGRHAEPNHVRLLRDCAQICLTSADFMLRGSDVFAWTCAACREVCERCADACERFDMMDGVMKQCGRVCRECADACAAWGARMNH